MGVSQFLVLPPVLKPIDKKPFCGPFHLNPKNFISGIIFAYSCAWDEYTLADHEYFSDPFIQHL